MSDVRAVLELLQGDPDLSQALSQDVQFVLQEDGSWVRVNDR